MDTYENLKTKAQDERAAARGWMQSHPFTWGLIAAAVAVALFFLLRP